MSFKKNLALSIFILSLSSVANADLFFKELGLGSGGQADNVQVINQNTETALGKYSFSYDIDEIIFNHQYDAAKHIIDTLPWSDQTKFYVFWHNAYIEKKLMPKKKTYDTVTLGNIIKKVDAKTDDVKNIEDFNAYIRFQYTRKLNEIAPVIINAKKGNILEFFAHNNTDYKVKKIKGNLRIEDTSSKRVLIDERVSYNINLPSDHMKPFTINMVSRLPASDWRDKSDNLSYRFTVTEIELSDGTVFNADDEYFKMHKRTNQLDERPFTAI